MEGRPGACAVRILAEAARRGTQGHRDNGLVGYSRLRERRNSDRPVTAAAHAWLPKGVPADAVAYYVDLLTKVRATPEWKEYIERSAQTDQFLTGAKLQAFIADNDQKSRKVFEHEGWLIH